MMEFKVGDKVVVNDNCRERDRVGEKRIVSMITTGLVFTTNLNGRNERGFRSDCLDKLD